MNSSNEPTCKKIQNYIFKFADLLGQGNFSKVYKAHNQVTNEIVAIKIVELNSLKSKKLEELLFSEIEVLKKLSHPNILRCFEVFTSNRNCYIITELCNEGDLETKLRSNRYFSEERAIPIIKDLYLGLEYLAEKNVIHRDLKVANIFLHNQRAKIADFGFAKFTKQEIAQFREKFKDINIGSPIYMSPEGLIDNIYGPKTDVWAFGVMIYELLHGETPFSNCKTETELKYSMSIPIGWSQLKSELSSELKEVILKCLETKQQKRPYMTELRKLSFFKKILENESESTLLNNFSLYPSEYKGLKDKQANGSKMSQNLSFNWKEIDPFSRDSFQPKHKQNVNKSMNEPNRASMDNHININKFNNESYNFQKKSTYKDAVDSSYRKKQETTRNKILSTEIGFKCCVNILHYCRLIYKYVSISAAVQYPTVFEESQKNVFIRWLAIVVKTINQKITNSKVIYEGENAALREQKLKQVSKQYEKKYSKELGINMDKIVPQESSVANYDYMCNYFYSTFLQVDKLLQSSEARENRNLLMLGHYITMIYESTKHLKSCYDQKAYRPFQSYKEVETMLNLKKDEMDYPSYMWYKKRFCGLK